MRSRKWQAVTVVIAVVVVLDQLSKEWAIDRLSRGRVIEILPTLELDLTYNSGFSFGTGAGHGPLVGTLVIALCGFICWRLWHETLYRSGRDTCRDPRRSARQPHRPGTKG